MKKNGNQKRQSDYYIGLDVGTDSVGWAVTDLDYNILRFKGNSMWGARLFEEAKTAAERRTSRTARRLNHRKRQRLELLELLFANEIQKIDASFFIRLKESALVMDDKSEKAIYPLFNDKGYTDKDYFKAYPTVYHLRNELISSSKPHDIRLVYLAIQHILKSRGHFLFDMEIGDNVKVEPILFELQSYMSEEYGIDLSFSDKQAFIDILSASVFSITDKKKALCEKVSFSGESEEINPVRAIEMLSGATIKFADLFKDEELKDCEKKSLSLTADLEAEYDIIIEAVGEERFELIRLLKAIFDVAKLAQMLGKHQYISAAKVEQFEINREELKQLKTYVKKYYPEKYKEIFSIKKDKLNNFAAYSGRTLKSGEYSCGQEDFCKYLLKELPDLKDNDTYKEIYNKIKNNNFLPRLKGSDNSVIPHQLHFRELTKILENASCYLDFLSEADGEGITVEQKIKDIFSFRIPYYVGPLNPKSPNAWLERTEEKIYPWNFEKVVNVNASAVKFIENLIGKCPYTGDDVLPKSSLLFSEYCVLNEINPLAVNGKKLPVEVKQEIYKELFVEKSAKVTKKSIKAFLLKKGHIKAEDDISGVDDVVKSKLQSYHDFKKFLDVEANYDMVEDIIRAITIFGDDKVMLRRWLKQNQPQLDKEAVSRICRLKYKDWGRLSKTILTEIVTPDEYGEAHTIIDMLRNTNENLMQLLSNSFLFSENAEKYRLKKYGKKENISELIEDMYVSPAVKRSLLQTVKIVDEIIDIRKSAPKKIFIEVARDKEDANKKQRTVSRKDKLLDLYKSCKKEYPDLYDAIKSVDESDLRKDALYLYYTQFGKCMYSGQPIELEKLSTDYDIDHIFPQSKIKDDSIDNRVLVLRKYNEEKGNKYPLPSEWRNSRHAFWSMLKGKGLISEKKYERLVRNTSLSDDELSSFVARQLVETRQSTKALAEVLKSVLAESGTKIVYSKAGNVSDFRQEFELIKCRDINDLHHAKDAYLNIVVGNVYDTRFTSAFFKNIRNENYSLNRVFDFNTAGAWDKDKSIGKVKSFMQKNSAIVTRMAYKEKGALFDLQLLPAGKGQLEVKNGLAIDTYGGYNNVKGSYFFVVEHTKNSKRIRTIEPVYIYKQKLYETEPLTYCREVLGLEEPKIIWRHILKDQALELDKKRMTITGRTGEQLVFKHNYQFAVSTDDEAYIKALSKYVARSIAERAEDGTVLSPKSDISKEKNEELYQMFIRKLQTSVYVRLFSGVVTKLVNCEDKFKQLSLYQQASLLLEILKLFKCDRQATNLKTVGDVKNAGIIRHNKSLANCNTAYVIHQSVTGLYEYRYDLLK